MAKTAHIEPPTLSTAIKRIEGVARVLRHHRDGPTLFTVVEYDGTPIVQSVSDRDIILLATGMELLGEVYDD